MRDRKVIEEMVALAERFGQTIEFDEFDGRGGWCRVKGTDRVIVNQRLTPREQIRILAQVLAGYPIEEQAMPPKVRQIIEDAKLELQPEPEPPIPVQEISEKQPIQQTASIGLAAGQAAAGSIAEESKPGDMTEASEEGENLDRELGNAQG